MTTTQLFGHHIEAYFRPMGQKEVGGFAVEVIRGYKSRAFLYDGHVDKLRTGENRHQGN